VTIRLLKPNDNIVFFVHALCSLCHKKSGAQRTRRTTKGTKVHPYGQSLYFIKLFRKRSDSQVFTKASCLDSDPHEIFPIPLSEIYFLVAGTIPHFFFSSL